MESCMKPGILALLGATLLIPRSLPAQEPKRDPLLEWMNQIAQRQLQARQRVIGQVHTVAEAERRKREVRETLLKLLGGLPDYSGPLNPKVTGEIKAEGYTIEKVLFESLPHFYVTADLYRPNHPNGPARCPAISFSVRPHSGGKARAAARRGQSGVEGFCGAGHRSDRPGREGANLRRATPGSFGGLVGSGTHPGGRSGDSRRGECGALLHLGRQAQPRLPGKPA